MYCDEAHDHAAKLEREAWKLETFGTEGTKRCGGPGNPCPGLVWLTVCSARVTQSSGTYQTVQYIPQSMLDDAHCALARKSDSKLSVRNQPNAIDRHGPTAHGSGFPSSSATRSTDVSSERCPVVD